MDILTANRLAQRLQISRDYVVREEYEVLILKEIYESEFGASLVFKGGTALRLAYGSPRFSEDLDFTRIADFDTAKFLTFLRRLENRYPTIKVVETIDKFFTVFGLIRINDPALDRAFSIKLEISKRAGEWLRSQDYQEKIIRSEATPLTLLAWVASLEMILREKTDAIKNRTVARDIFDYWYLNQLLHQEVPIDFSHHNKEAAKSELHRLLPKSYWHLADLWLE